jgi:rare lipoprotein A
MKPVAKIQTVTSALLLMTMGGWSLSLAAPASDGATTSEARTLDDTRSDASRGEAPSDSRSVERARRLSPEAKPNLDRSGHKRIGKASFYAKMFAGRTMADGTRMEPTGNNAASLTLPLGTTAKVTNLETGKTAVVTIRDRGPYVAGRIVDLSPATAREIGLDKRTGVTKVEVAPIAVPMPDGEIKLGDGVLQASNRWDGSDRLGVSGRIEMRSPRAQ